MPHTTEDCSKLCRPPDVNPGNVPEESHASCEADLMDFSDPGKKWSYCACDCHHKPGMPGYQERTSGRHVTREQARKFYRAAMGGQIVHVSDSCDVSLDGVTVSTAPGVTAPTVGVLTCDDCGACTYPRLVPNADGVYEVWAYCGCAPGRVRGGRWRFSLAPVPGD